ncbi:glycoside hydrolase family 3 N-terminal domain-containing protein [Intrasporangium sp.]|uniref:glycoside hydrolase family 3 N-terminal domain-containing protein n=1 Tax=Intrasporangium sp. TaxID=1925024 RepID=UPI002939E8E3|nr:glycoside hydrolase family 3 N-terminal domain-containing protein [Intrasporangium sp.]MDV3220532.1 hypothetical protein [Intrasporangium sp.]
MTSPQGALRRLVHGTLMPGFVGTAAPAWITEAYAAGLAAVCLHGPNMAGSQALSALCAALRAGRPDVLIAIDEEGGDVTRVHYLEGSPEPGNAVLGRLDDTRLTRDSAARVGRELTAYGINLALAPVVDVNSADDNPVIGARSFGGSPDHVSRHSAAWLDGIQGEGVAACAKHFPGHGDTTVDSHHALPRITASRDVLEVRELAPFRAAVAARAASIMTSHVVVEAVDPDVPATFSQRLLQGVLRGDLGFEGVIVSDALDMEGASGGLGVPEAAVRALAAGCDLLCLGFRTSPRVLGSVVDTVVHAVDTGRLPQRRVVEAAERVARLAAGWTPVAAGTSGTTPAPLTSDLVRDAFAVGARARAWLRLPGAPVIVQVETPSNPAVGDVPWGPSAAGATIERSLVPQGAKVAVAGRGLEPGHPARQLAEQLRASGRETILVECGWPRGEADIVTFGASRLVGQALAELLGVDAGSAGRRPGQDPGGPE